jgi:hypothetical protein
MNISKIAADGRHDIIQAEPFIDNPYCHFSSENSYDSNIFSTQTAILNSKCTCNENPKASYTKWRNGKLKEPEQEQLIKIDLPNTKIIQKQPIFTCIDNSFTIFSDCGFVMQKYVSKFITNSCNMCQTYWGTKKFDLKRKCSHNFILNVIKLSCIVNLFKKCSFISLLLVSYILFSTIRFVDANELTPQKNLGGAEETGGECIIIFIVLFYVLYI